MKKVAIGLVVGWMLSTVALAEEDTLSSLSGTSNAVKDVGGCASNFSVTGSYTSGKQFKTSVVLPEVGSQVAFRRANAVITKSDHDWTGKVYRITKSDEKTGVITAVWGGFGNQETTPLLTLHIESVSGAGAKIDFTFSIAGGTSMSIDGVGNAFCKITSAVLSSAAPDSANTVEKANATDAQSEVKASNSEFIKNGMPCIKELCLGDGIKELRKIKWDTARKASAFDIKYYKDDLERTFRGNLIASTPYLIGDQMTREFRMIGSGQEFDNQALSKLDEVIAICKQHRNFSGRLIGRFTTPSRNPTMVSIALIPTEDNKKQRWTVVSIVRSFPNTITDKQKEEVHAQLDERYGAFKLAEQTEQEYKNGDVRYVGSGDGFTLKTLWKNLDDRLYLHPSCGGTAKVKID